MEIYHILENQSVVYVMIQKIKMQMRLCSFLGKERNANHLK